MTVSLSGIVMQYPGTRALDDVSVAFRFDEVHGLIGENGAGKTTLVSILAGNKKPTAGKVTIDGKEAVLLAYPNEGHGLRGIANRRDLTIRFFEFFDHYLKDAPAPKWLSDGVPYLAKTDATTTNTTR